MFQDNIKSTARYIYSQIICDAEYANECKVLSDLLDGLDAQTMLKDDASDLLGTALYLSTLLSSNEGPSDYQDLLEIVSKIIKKEGQRIRRGNLEKFKGLYVIIDPEITNDRDPFLIAQGAVSGGAKILQLRDKNSDKGLILELAHKLQELCKNSDTVLIINDHADIAKAVQCFGLHVGQTDLSVEASRSVLNINQHIGRSNRELDQLEESQSLDIDHVAFGPMFSTRTKVIDREPQGIERLQAAREISSKPLVAIGGINIDNIEMVMACSPDAICVTGAVGLAENPEKAARALSKCIEV